MKEKTKKYIKIIEEVRNLPPGQLQNPLKYIDEDTLSLIKEIESEDSGFELPKGWIINIENFGKINEINFIGLYAAPLKSYNLNKTVLKIRKPFHIPFEATEGQGWVKLVCLSQDGMKKLNEFISSQKSVSERKLFEVIQKYNIKKIYRIAAIQRYHDIKEIFSNILMQARASKLDYIRVMMDTYNLIVNDWSEIEEKGVERFIQENEEDDYLKTIYYHHLQKLPVLTRFQFISWGSPNYAIIKFFGEIFNSFIADLRSTNYFKLCLACGCLFWIKKEKDKIHWDARKYCGDECLIKIRESIKYKNKISYTLPHNNIGLKK